MKILVVGSINIDEVSELSQFPISGQTVTSLKSMTFQGGKGANQAVSIKRLSGDDHTVSMFAKTGSNNDDILQNLKKENIDTKYVSKSKLETGKAIILLSEAEKNNIIIINKGANEDFGPDDLNQLEEAIKSHDLLLMQLETNDWIVSKALEIAKKNKKITVMNPAPSENFRQEWLEKIDWLIPNETELEHITSVNVDSIEGVKEGINKLRKFGSKNLIVTLGESGVFLSTSSIEEHYPTKKIVPVDTTAAGDTFIGGFISMMDKGLEQAIHFGMKASRITISRYGAQVSIPTKKEVENEKN